MVTDDADFYPRGIRSNPLPIANEHDAKPEDRRRMIFADLLAIAYPHEFPKLLAEINQGLQNAG